MSDVIRTLCESSLDARHSPSLQAIRPGVHTCEYCEKEIAREPRFFGDWALLDTGATTTEGQADGQ